MRRLISVSNRFRSFSRIVKSDC